MQERLYLDKLFVKKLSRYLQWFSRQRKKIKIVQFWYETRSFVSVKRRFRREYGCNPSETPHNNAISRIVHHFEKEGTVHGKNQGRSGRSPVVTGDGDKVEEVRESVSETPQTSTRHRSQELRMSRTSLRRVLRRKLKYHPYRIAELHKLTQTDRERRLAMCSWVQQKQEECQTWIRHVWFTDEAHFHLDGRTNSHNNVFWSQTKPDHVTEAGRMGARVTCLVAFNARHGLLGPYWFEDEEGRTVSVNQERYRDVLKRLHEDMAKKMSENQLRLCWFMQDGAPPRTARGTLQLLQDLFRHRVFTKGSENEWAPHSPDLNPLDFWFWGACKSAVYGSRPGTLEQLRLSVEEYVSSVSADTVDRVGTSFLERVL